MAAANINIEVDGPTQALNNDSLFKVIGIEPGVPWPTLLAWLKFVNISGMVGLVTACMSTVL